jgi:hypothetical protein
MVVYLRDPAAACFLGQDFGVMYEASSTNSALARRFNALSQRQRYWDTLPNHLGLTANTVVFVGNGGFMSAAVGRGARPGEGAAKVRVCTDPSLCIPHSLAELPVFAGVMVMPPPPCNRKPS